jgi:hypothetical protein
LSFVAVSKVLSRLVPAHLVPESELDPIPESKFVIDAAKIILYDMLSRADGFGDFNVFESLGDELDDLLLAWAGDAASIEAACGHGRTRF